MAESTKYMSCVKVGPKGQIVIPKEVREMFSIQPGDTLLLLADSERGMALERYETMEKMADAVFDGRAPSNDEGVRSFARGVKAAGEGRKVKG